MDMGGFGLSERVAIVTGGATGIGRGIAQLLAEEGCRVVIADIDENQALATAAELRGRGCAVLPVHADVTSPVDTQAMVKTCLDVYGRVDILVNNAGVCTMRDWLKMDVADLDVVMRVNVHGVLLCSQAVVPPMIQQRFGRIITLVSAAIRRPGPINLHYAASKAAALVMTQGIAQAVVDYGITANAVSPGLVPEGVWSKLDDDFRMLTGKSAAEVMTERKARIPMKTFNSPEDVAFIVACLASPRAQKVTGQLLFTDGGGVMP